MHMHTHICYEFIHDLNDQIRNTTLHNDIRYLLLYPIRPQSHKCSIIPLSCFFVPIRQSYTLADKENYTLPLHSSLLKPAAVLIPVHSPR